MATPTQADLDAIDAKIASIRGIKAQTLADRSVTFDLEGLVRERARVQSAIDAGANRSRTRYVSVSKGV